MILLFPYFNKNKPKLLILDIIKYSYFINEGTERTEKDFKDLLLTYFGEKILKILPTFIKISDY